MRAGVHRIDVTPPPGLVMAGFGARTQPAAGAHDALTVRAIVVDDTALVTADILGLDEDMSRRVRARCCLPDGNVVLAATHTHGGPASMTGRAGGGASAVWLQRLEEACVEAIDRAATAAGTATIAAGLGPDPDVARNRRRPDGPLDRALPVLRINKASGEPLAFLVSYACHPVVLGADNLLWTADYPGFVRERIEAAHPGAMAMFLTGCAGEANTGHTAQASMTPAKDPARSFPRAEELGRRIADAALAAPLEPAAGPTLARDAFLDLTLERRETAAPAALAAAWRAERAGAPLFRAMILDHWIAWAEGPARQPLDPWRARVGLLRWGGVRIVALPGEIFAATALEIRAGLGRGPAFVAAYCEGNPGYIPPRDEYAFGGYEIDEAHRYYGLPAAFAPGSAEALAAAVLALGREAC